LFYLSHQYYEDRDNYNLNHSSVLALFGINTRRTIKQHNKVLEKPQLTYHKLKAMVQQSIHLCRIKGKKRLSIALASRVYSRFADLKGSRRPILPINQFMDKIHSTLESKLNDTTLDGVTPPASRPCVISTKPYHLLEKNSPPARMFKCVTLGELHL
jgi:hypothetical protein